MTDEIVSPQACKRIKKLLSRSLDIIKRKATPENQVDGFLGEGLPKRTRLRSKAGLMSQVRNDAAWFNLQQGNPMLLVVFSQGRQSSLDQELFPALARELITHHTEMG